MRRHLQNKLRRTVLGRSLVVVEKQGPNTCRYSPAFGGRLGEVSQRGDWEWEVRREVFSQRR